MVPNQLVAGSDCTGQQLWLDCLWTGFIIAIQPSTDTGGSRLRPIYNVAHMVNANSQINEDWVNDANAIEADLTFYPDGTPKEFYHGFPCDCGRYCWNSDDPLSHFASYRQKAQDESQNFVLVWMDFKISESGMMNYSGSGEKVAELMTREGSLFPLGEDVPINVLLGAETPDQKDFFLGFRDYISTNRPELLPKFGYVFSGTDIGVDEILNTFEGMGITENIWVGAGNVNCLTMPIEKLRYALAKRDSYTDGSGLAPFKVYAWTVDRTSTMREYLQLGVDIIIVNYPGRMKALVTDEFHDSLVLATRPTDPWERIKESEVVAPLAQGCSRSYCWKYTDPDNWCWTENSCSNASDCWGSLSCS